jgi:hypothetical protein
MSLTFPYLYFESWPKLGPKLKVSVALLTKSAIKSKPKLGNQWSDLHD